MIPNTMQGTFQSHTVEVDGAQIHYVSGGSGDSLLLLHGWPLTWYSWRKVMPSLAGRYRVSAPDLPGLGNSGPSPVSYRKHLIAKLLRTFGNRVVGRSPIYLVGHDMGVPIAYAIARQFPEAVQRLVVLDVPINGFGLDEFAKRLHLWHFGFFRAPGLAEALVAGREQTYIEHWYPGYAPDAIHQGGLIPGCGHYLAEEKPEALLDELYRFFEDTKG